MHTYKHLIVYVSLFFLFSANVLAKSKATVVPREDVHYYADRDGSLSIEEVKKLEFTGDIAALGHYTNDVSAWWLKVDLSSYSGSDAAGIYHSVYHEVTFYNVQQGIVVDSMKKGLFQPFSNQQDDYADYLFLTDITEESTLYVKIKARYTIPYLELNVGDKEALLKMYEEIETVLFYYSGACIIIILFNIFLFFSLRDKVYLLYALSVFFVWMSNLCMKGVGYKYYWGESEWLSIHSFEFFVSLSPFFIIQFVRVFLNTKVLIPKVDKVYNTLKWVILANLVLALITENGAFTNIMSILIAVFSPFSFVVGLLCFLKNSKQARFVLIAQSVFMIVVIFAEMANFGVFEWTHELLYAIEFASGFEMLFFSFALADRINITRKEKEKADEELRLLLENQNQLLEAEVASKTKDLHKVNNELKTRMLSAQMNPHFIFNVLNSIQSFVLNERREEAGKYMAKFSRLMRFYLSGSLKKFIPLNEEIDALKRYLDLEKLRYKNTFDYTIELGENVLVDMLEVPGMLIMPFLENAIWHGLVEQEKHGEITVCLQLIGKSLRVEIVDNGIGISASKERKYKNEEHESVGISITEERLKLIHEELKSDFYFELQDLNNGNSGTVVKFNIPYLTHVEN